MRVTTTNPVATVPIPADGRYSLRLLALYRLFVALFLVWLGLLPLGDPGFIPVAPVFFKSVALLYLALAGILVISSLAGTPRSRMLQVTLGAVLDIVALSALLLAAGGVNTGLGLLLIPAVAGIALLTNGRVSLFMAALAALSLLVTELLLGPHLSWAYTTAPTQTGLLGATLFFAAILAWSLARRANRSEVHVARQQRDLAKWTELNAQIIARMDSGVIALDSDGYILSINAAAQRLLPMHDARTLRDLAPRLATALRQWCTESPLPATHQFAGSGEQIALEVRVIPLGASPKEGILLILEDATEIRRRLHASKLQSLGRLTASIAHEVRNPLSAIRHSAQLLAEDPHLEPASQRLLQIIQNQSDRVERLMRNILSLSSGRPAQRERLVLQQRVRTFVDEFCTHQHLATETLRIEAPEQPLAIQFDPTQLHQVLWNVCLNALQHAGHAQPGSQPLLLRLGLRRAAPTAVLDVIDAGPGISDAQQESLFEPFSSTAPGGTGLGLYISRLLCESNGATLEYVPQHCKTPYHGGCFRVQFAALDE